MDLKRKSIVIPALCMLMHLIVCIVAWAITKYIYNDAPEWVIARDVLFWICGTGICFIMAICPLSLVTKIVEGTPKQTETMEPLTYIPNESIKCDPVVREWLNRNISITTKNKLTHIDVPIATKQLVIDTVSTLYEGRSVWVYIKPIDCSVRTSYTKGLIHFTFRLDGVVSKHMCIDTFVSQVISGDIIVDVLECKEEEETI